MDEDILIDIPLDNKKLNIESNISLTTIILDNIENKPELDLNSAKDEIVQNATNIIENNNLPNIPEVDISGNVVNTGPKKDDKDILKDVRLKQYNDKCQEYVNKISKSNIYYQKIVDVLVYRTNGAKYFLKSLSLLIKELFELSLKILLCCIGLTFNGVKIAFDLLTYTILNSFPQLMALITYSIISVNYKFKTDYTNGMISFFAVYSLLLSHYFIILNTCEYKKRSDLFVILAVHLIKLTEIGLEIFYIIEFNKTYTDLDRYTYLLSSIAILTGLYYVLMPFYLKHYCNNYKLLTYYEQEDKLTKINETINEKYGNIIIQSFIKFTNQELSEHKCVNEECKDCECSICYCKDTNKFIKTKCNHLFHIDCLEKWLSTDIKQNQEFSCPMCRTDIFEYS